MTIIQMPSPLKLTLATLICVIVGGGIYGLGYWQGHRVMPAEKVIPSYGNNLAAQASPPAIPANASPEMKEFLQNQASLAGQMERLRRESPNGVLGPQVFIQFHQENADLLKRQNQLAQVIAGQQNKSTLISPPLQIPPKASPQLTAYLTLRDQIMRDEIAFMNQHKADDLAARQAATQQWRQQNATRFQNLQHLAQALTPAQNSSIK